VNKKLTYIRLTILQIRVILVVSRLIIVISIVAVAIGSVVVTQSGQIQNSLEETMKPSATACEFTGQRLSEDYYCVFRQVNGQSYFDVEKINENQVPICGSVRMEGTRIDANGVGSVTLVKDSGCIDTILSITAGGIAVKSISVGGIVQFSPNYELKVGETRVPISFDFGTTFPEGSAITVGVGMQGRSSSVTAVTVLPAGSVPTVSSSNNDQQQLVLPVTGGKEISTFQRIFVKELFNQEGALPAYTGIHTSFAKSVSVAVEADSLVTVTIEGTDCVIQGSSFDRMCDVPSNADVILKVEGIGQAHVIIRLHYFL